MKKFAKIAILFLVAVLALSLCGCESTADKMEKLSGTYSMEYTDDAEQAEYLLEFIGCSESEIAVADMNSFTYVQVVSFDAEGNYYFANDGEATRDCVYDFYKGFVADVYENRVDLYGADFSDITEDDFNYLLASGYGYEDYEAMLNDFADSAYDYDVLSEPWETGTYTIRNGQILCTITGETEAEALGYNLDGNTLKLIYSDGEEVYTKVN